ncbi:MAG: Clp protease N-terminal domain-containing protein, partial [Spirochaetaceae bacterium]|nr:Clp protease N-terminal domain-containing protein [Spirochaetaceae bacterium]
MAKNLSPRAQKLVTFLAQDEGKKSGSEQILPEHILLALLKSADGLGYILLQKL